VFSVTLPTTHVSETPDWQWHTTQFTGLYSVAQKNKAIGNRVKEVHYALSCQMPTDFLWNPFAVRLASKFVIVVITDPTTSQTCLYISFSTFLTNSGKWPSLLVPPVMANYWRHSVARYSLFFWPIPAISESYAFRSLFYRAPISVGFHLFRMFDCSLSYTLGCFKKIFLLKLK